MIDEGGYAVGTKSDLTGGMNSLDKQNVMWGAGIQVADQAEGYAGFFTHHGQQGGAPMPNRREADQQAAPQPHQRDRHPPRLVGPSTRSRPTSAKKFAFANVASFLGDYIYMRVEEMYFTAAEAALRLDDLQERTRTDEHRHGRTRPGVRTPTNPQRHAARRDDHDLDRIVPSKTSSPTAASNCGVSTGRLFDVRRLGQGIDRRTDDGFSEECISMMNRRNVNITKADTHDWVLTIPKAELDANPNINEEDQNPLTSL